MNTPIHPLPINPIVMTRNRVPRITFIKRASRPKWLYGALMFFAGACSAGFLALMALVVMKWHPFR